MGRRGGEEGLDGLKVSEGHGGREVPELGADSFRAHFLAEEHNHPVEARGKVFPDVLREVALGEFDLQSHKPASGSCSKTPFTSG